MRTFTRAGLTFDVVDSGPADGPVVVLLHGFPQQPDSWAEVTPHLTAAGYRCLVPAQRGYSPAARPRGRRAYRSSELIGDVLALADAAGAERVHVVGHDWGAAVAWAFAADHPERVASLTTFSVAHPAAFLRALVTTRQFLASWYMYFFQLPWLPERVLLRDGGAGLARFLVKGGQREDRARRDAAALAVDGAGTAALNWYRAMPLAGPRSVRTRVAAPTLFVWSDEDAGLTRASTRRCGQWVSGPYRFVELAGVSHWIPDEVPGRAADLILEQVRAHPA